MPAGREYESQARKRAQKRMKPEKIPEKEGEMTTAEKSDGFAGTPVPSSGLTGVHYAGTGRRRPLALTRDASGWGG
jgi:hypothetical protein